MRMSFLPDVPIVDEDEELLGFGEFIDVLQSAIYETQSPFVYGVLGDWGVGKTSILNLLRGRFEADLERDDSGKLYVPIWFNAWKYENEVDIVFPLLHAIKKSFVSRFPEADGDDTTSTFLQRFVEVVATSSYVLGDLGLKAATKTLTGEGVGLGDIDEARQTLMARRQADDWSATLAQWVDTVEHLETAFAQLLAAYAEAIGQKHRQPPENVNVVILIDDLDRCLPETTIAILEGVKNYLSVHRAIFVFGLNPNVVYQGIRLKYRGLDINGREYLEKILNYTFYVPEPSSKHIQAFALKRLKQLVKDDPAHLTHRFDEFAQVVSFVNFNNPRKIKRILNRYLLFITRFEQQLDSFHMPNIIRLIILAEYFPDIFQMILGNERFIGEASRFGSHEFDVHQFEQTFGIDISARYGELSRMQDVFKGLVDGTGKRSHLQKDAAAVFNITRMM